MNFAYIVLLLSFNQIITTKVQEEKLLNDAGQQFSKLKNYQIITPIEFSAGYISSDEATNKSQRFFQIEAFGIQYDLLLEKQKHFDGTSIEYYGHNNTFQKKIFKDIDCFYSGNITSSSNTSINVILNYCHGLEGIIETKENTLFIEPLKNVKRVGKNFPSQHLVYRLDDIKDPTYGADRGTKDPANAPHPSFGGLHRRVRRSGYESFLHFTNRANRRVQLYYLDSYQKEVPFIAFLYNEKRGVNTFTGTTWLAKDDKTNDELLLNGKKRFVATTTSSNNRIEVKITVQDGTIFNETPDNNQVLGTDNYMEVMVVADDSVIKFHGRDKVEKYILTMMNIAGHVFSDKSLGVKIKFEVVRVVLLEENSGGFNVYNRNPTRSLVSACNYVTTLANSDPNHPDHFDFAIVLTRKPFGPSGYAQLYSMCSKRRSCAIARDEGLTSAFIVAHETGHLLGLDHDGEGEASRCSAEGPRGSVMAPIIQARYDRFHWSSCSREVVEENIEYFLCLKNVPQARKKNLKNNSPGALYTLDEQCKFNFEKDYTRCTSFRYNPCQILWCNDPQRAYYCKTMRGPALEGSVCGRNKHCMKGDCIEIDNNTGDNNDNGDNNGDNNGNDNGNNVRPTVTIVNGNWGSWTAWSKCSQSCNIGVRERDRLCDNPRPGTNGKQCDGDNYERDVCSSQPCNVVKSFDTLRLEECSKLHGQGWTIYSDRAFQLRLRQPRYNLNCTFQEGFCRWKNDDTKSEIPWERIQGKTPSINTGPEYDNTLKTNKGSYLYIEASSTARRTKKKGDVARLESVKLNVPRVCFSMFYHMFGKDMGSLKVNVIYTNNGSEVNLWQVSGNKDQRWNFMETSIESLSEYKIVVEAVRGRHWAGDIAIDDFSINAGLCRSTEREINPCSISCRSRDAQRFQLESNVTDGLQCSASRDSNICLKGRCVKFGCDNNFVSNLRLDNCGVCGGNGSSCVKMNGHEEITPKNDYEVIVKLTKGSTFINLTADTIGRYYFGLRKSASTGIYLSTNTEDYYVIEGSTFHFRKGRSGKHEIIANGPLTESLEVVVYSFQRKPIKMEYEYFVPSEYEYTYKYETAGWTDCSKTCGIGEKSSLSTCTRIEDGERVAERYCKDSKKPLYVKACNLEECLKRTKWLIREWSPCSKSCGRGKQLRVVACIEIDSNEIVENSYCTKTPLPTNINECNTQACPRVYKWRAGGWGSCSTTCGAGIKRRTVTCVVEQTNNAVSSSLCKQTTPDLVEPCNMQDCDNYIYEVRLEGVCSKTCGGGIKARIVYCVNKKTKAIVLNRYCDGPSPPRIYSCNVQVCPEYTWKAITSSPCTVTCGTGTIKRNIVCVDKKNEKVVDKRKCQEAKPNEVISCTESQCPFYQLSYGVWSTCSTICGPGQQSRSVKCIDNNSKEHGLDFCDRSNMVSTQPCETTQCSKPDDLKCTFDSNSFCKWINVKEEDTFDWSSAKQTPSQGTGPLNDHTTGRGYFAYIEASRPRQRGDTAKLISPPLSNKQGCLTFWYHMRGSSIGKMVVYINEKNVLQVQGQQGTSWKLAKIDTSQYQSTHNGYRFTIEATVGFNVYSDIAIDDVTFQDKPCSNIADSIVTKTKVPPNCREISPYCKHAQREQHCRESTAYRSLCCRTCAAFV